MKINKLKNMSKNILSGFIYRILSVIFPFIIRTVIIKTLSSEYLGLTSLFTSVLQALNLMELGLGSALVFNMYKYVAVDDKEKLSNYLNFYKICYRFIGIFIFVIGIILLPFIKNFINGSLPLNVNIYILFLIYLLNTVVSYWLFAYKNSIALAYQKTSIENYALIFSQTLMYIFQIIVLVITKNYTFYVILLPISTVIKNLLTSYKVDKEFPDIKPHGNITKEERENIISNIKSLFGHQIAFTVINSADNIILSGMLGLEDVAIYNNYYYVISALINIMTIIFNSIQAGIGNSIIVDDKEQVYQSFKNFRCFVFTISCIFSVCLFSTYQIFMKIWMGEQYLLPYYSTVIFSLGFYITQIRRVVTTYKNAAGLWKEDFFKPYIWIILDIILDFILIPIIGVTGAMIATIVSALIVAIPIETYILYKKIFNEKFTKHFLYMGYEFLIYIACIVIVYLLTKINFNQNFINLIYYCFIGLIIPIIINCIIKWRSKEFMWMRQRIKILIQNKI